MNPIYGSVGLLWSGSWQQCQAAVEAVLKGAPITPITSEAAASGRGPPLKAHDIRHVSKEEDSTLDTAQRVKARSGFKRLVKPRARKVTRSEPAEEENRSTSHESSLSHPCKESESGVSVEASVLFHDEPESNPNPNEIYRAEESGDEVGLELTLGFEPVSRADHVVPVKKRRIELKDWSVSCKMELGLELAA